VSDDTHIVPEELLVILRCPACHEELDERRDPPVLVCRGCRRSYRVEDGIPNLLVDEALPPEPDRP